MTNHLTEGAMTSHADSGPRRRRPPSVLRLLAAGLATAVAAAGPLVADPLSLRIDPARSSLTFTISRPGETVEGKAPGFSGEVRVEPEHPEQGASVLLRVEAASLDTGNGIRDKKMRKSHLEVATFPQIVFQSTSVSFQDPQGPLRPGAERQAMVEGRLDLHGVARTVRIPVRLRYDGASLAADGEVAFALSDHKIPIPRFLWIELDDKVTIRFHVVTGKAG
jgi:polyisoprenoid-binding protein YceI